MKSHKEAVECYLALRRGLGFKLRSAGLALFDFAAFLDREHAPHITNELALRWAMLPRECQPALWAARLRYVRGLARHCRATDPRTEIPPESLLPFRPGRARPYLYSEQEIQRLLVAAAALPSLDGLRGATYSCLFGLLAVTGLRISEAIALEVRDVDLRQGVLTIRGAKFGKSRLVPLHVSTQRVLARYAQRRDRLLGSSNPPRFLVNNYGRSLESSSVRRVFYRLSRQIGLRGPADRHGPRLHDFRHRFAVGTLMRWYRSGQDAERRLPVLSTYLGHAHIADTYWYLSAHPQLMGLAKRRLEKRWEIWP
ncbi:MAG: tyrosine-type recombinase/integrase [Steroidobacterales bacterium]